MSARRNSPKVMQPEPKPFALSRIVDKVEDGYIVIPRFQREFVWPPEATAKLFDSILKGYPIGTFTFWNTKTRLRMVKTLGGKKFRIAGSGNTLNYVLDGQQRITSIYACLKGITVGDYCYENVSLRLDDVPEGENLVTTNVDGLNGSDYISIRDLFQGGIGLADKYPQKYRAKIDAFHNFLLAYQLSSIEVPETTLEVATDIFTRINTTGKKLTSYEILCAKVYDEKTGFDLIEKRESQVARWGEKNYGSFSDMTVMQAMSLCAKGSCKTAAMLSLTNKDFLAKWNALDEAFSLAIDYFKSHLHIPSTKLLPYDVLIIPYVYYFFKKKDKRMEVRHAKPLANYFWRSVLSSYYVEGVPSKLDASLKYVDAVMRGKKLPELPCVDISEDAIRRDGKFTFSSAYAKGFLCILAAQQPQAFDTGARIQMDGDWLSQANSINYHHFFPKAYMAKHHKEFDPAEVNHVVNITIVDRYLNQNKIRARAPSSYVKDYAHNRGLKRVLATHLIGDPRTFGIKTDDYGKFFSQRVALFQAEFKKRLVKQKGDKWSN